MLDDKERLMAAIERGVERCPMPTVDKLVRLAWLISRADTPPELQAYEDALGVVMPPERVFH